MADAVVTGSVANAGSRQAVARRKACMGALVLAAFAAVLAACGWREAPAGEAALAVMTFNIRYGTAREADVGDEWAARAIRVRDVVAAFDPDLLGIQEALRFQIDSLRSWFPALSETGVGRDDGERAGEYSAILYRADRLELLEGRTEWLSETPEVPGSKSWGNEIPRIVTWARFRDVESSRTFYVYNTHWDHQSQPSRERSAAYLLDRIGAREHALDPVLVTGDFNAGGRNAAIIALLAGDGSARLLDTFRAVRGDTTGTGTFNGFTGAMDGDRIDAILASPEWLIRDAAIVRTSYDGRFPSDHFPVVARVVLQ